MSAIENLLGANVVDGKKQPVSLASISGSGKVIGEYSSLVYTCTCRSKYAGLYRLTGDVGVSRAYSHACEYLLTVGCFPKKHVIIYVKFRVEVHVCARKSLGMRVSKQDPIQTCAARLT